MSVEAARALLDAGLSDIFELNGRSAESLFAELSSKHKDTEPYLLPYFRLAVYFAENADQLDQAKLHPEAWK